MSKISGLIAQYSELSWGIVYVILSIAMVVSAASAHAQPVKKVPRIGFLGANRTPRTEAFRQGLREIGYVEEKTILVEYRFAERELDRLPSLAAELVRLNVEVIVTAGAAATRPAKEATVTIPIVMANDNDPVGAGFIASLARPGRNIKGLSNLSPEISGKQLESFCRKLSLSYHASLSWGS